MLGRDVTAELAPRHELRPFAREALDVTDFAQVSETVAEVAPDVIVNCAAYTDVDGCESDPEGAYSGNALAPRHLAVAAHAAGAALLHVSTDYVFPGDAERPYAEFDPVGPATAYGRSKLAGEEAVRAHCPRHYIVRSAWLYGEHGHHFVGTIQKLAAEKERLTVVDDQIGNPTWTADLARVIGQLIETGAFGTYHATAEEEVSWHGFATEIVRLSGLSTPVDAVTSDRFPRPAQRPAYSALDNFCLRKLGIEMPGWRESLEQFFAATGHPPVQGRSRAADQ